jgi:hypothetical protein
VGVLLGLSSASVVGGVVAALAAVLAAYFGLSRASKPDDGSNVRIATFGVFAAAALIFGIEARAHNWLGADPKEQVDRWVAAGVLRPRAVDLVQFKELGIVPPAAVLQAPPKPSIHESMLFSGSASECDALEKGRFGSPELRRQSFVDAGGVWAETARASEGLPPSQIDQLLEATYTLACLHGERR